MPTQTAHDEQHMRRALALARRGQGRVEPNPMVGCVIVKKGRIIGEGYHHRFGGPHAERDALRRCQASAGGATVYVTLEPCCHHGKTPPCTDALIAARVKRVVAAVRDPHPQVAGRGLALLRQAGMDVQEGLLADEARDLNAPFFKLQEQHRPWVILKWAQSLDGKIATYTYDSKWISDETCRAHAHRVRARLDAIIVGRNTVRTDNPLLTARNTTIKRVATRVVLDSHLRTPTTSKLVRTAHDVPTWICCAPSASTRRQRTLERAGCIMHHLRPTRAGLSLTALLDLLGKHEMSNVLVEGGGTLIGRFADQHLADEIHLYIAPLLIGGHNAPGPLHAAGAKRVANAIRLPHSLRPRPLGTGWLLQTRLAPPSSSR